jgi:AcrR family transcriptional regulator
MKAQLSTTSETVPDERRQRIVAAATQAFSRHGYRRCTMGDIALAAGCSRPALYLHFADKEAVFRALAAVLLADAAAAAAAAWPAGLAVAEGLAAAVLAKDLPLFRLIRSSPHADEIMAESKRLCTDLHDASAAQFASLLEARLAAAGFGDAAGMARLVVNAAAGIKSAGLDERDYVADVTRLAGLVAGSLNAGGAALPKLT